MVQMNKHYEKEGRDLNVEAEPEGGSEQRLTRALSAVCKDQFKYNKREWSRWRNMLKKKRRYGIG